MLARRRDKIKIKQSDFRVHAFNIYAPLPLLKVFSLLKRDKERPSISLLWTDKLFYLGQVLPFFSLILMPYFKINIKSVISILIFTCYCLKLEVKLWIIGCRINAKVTGMKDIQVSVVNLASSPSLVKIFSTSPN